MSKERIIWFDFLRGVAILMVVSIHTFAATVQNGSQANDLTILLRQVLNCAVPLFLAISGYFLARKKSERSYLQFWKRQIPKVYIPTLIWSLPYLALYIWQGNDWLKGIVIFAVCGFSIYYFIALIVQYYLLFPVLQKVKMGGGNFSICCDNVGNLLRFLFGSGQRIWHEFHCQRWTVSCVVGLFCGRHLFRKSEGTCLLSLAVVTLFGGRIDTFVP